MFLYQTMECLRDENLNVAARQMAGILFKNTIFNTTKDIECEGLWDKLSEDQRDSLKTGSLEALGNTDLNVVRAAASCISSMCVVEFPKGRWLNVLEILCSNSDHDQREIRYASLVTLGYICEELMPEEISKEYSDYVITSFLDSLEKHFDDSELIEQSIKGIYHSLKFSAENFRANQGKIIMDKVILAAKYNDESVREISMQCVVEVVRLYYDYIEPFLADISNVTVEAAKSDVTQVKTQAIEVWSSIAEEENMRQEKQLRHLNIIDTAFEMLEELIEGAIQDLNIGNEDLDEEQEWGTSVSAGCCLSLVSQVVKDKVVAPITEFVAANIDQSKSWECKYSGILALGAILEGPSSTHLQQTLEPAVPILLDLIDDHHPRVRYAICWLFSKLAKHHYKLLTSNTQNIKSLFNKILNGLKEDVKIAANVATIVTELADSVLNIEEGRVSTCPISSIYEELLGALWDFIMRNDTNSDADISRIRVAGFSAMYNLLQYAPKDCENTSLSLMETIVGMIQNSVEEGVELDVSSKELQGFFFCALQCILTNVESPIETRIGEEIIDLVFRSFRNRAETYDEAFLALSALANKFPDQLNNRVDELGQFIVHALQSKNAAIIRNACGVLSDLCTLVESPGITRGFKAYMPILLELLKDPGTERSVKIIIISLIGDTFLQTGCEFEEFFKESLELLEGASMMAVDVIKSEEDNPEYMFMLSQLQSSLVESYTCFVQNIDSCGSTMFQEFSPFVHNIFNFLLKTTDPIFRPSLVCSLF